MLGTTLIEIRDHVEALAVADGEYLVRCGQTGDRPVPVSGLRFADRSTARTAASAAGQYRTALRRYDPQVPYCDLIVCQETETELEPVAADSEPGTCPTPERRSATDWTLSDPVVNRGRRDPGRDRLVEFCHTVAAALFETLSEAGYDGVESAAMDTYLERAETVRGPDDLCLCLLESLATELDERLSPADQAALLADAAGRLPPREATDSPVSTALSLLEARGVLGGYTRPRRSTGPAGGTRSAVVGLSEYALRPRDGCLPVLPIVLEVYRRRPDLPPSSLRAVSAEDGWRITLVLGRDSEPGRLASVPITPEA